MLFKGKNELFKMPIDLVQMKEERTSGKGQLTIESQLLKFNKYHRKRKNLILIKNTNFTTSRKGKR